MFEPSGVDGGKLFRHATAPLFQWPAPKALGDCYLPVLSQGLPATLVTLDGCLASLAGDLSVVLLS